MTPEQCYLQDVLKMLVERAKEAKAASDAAKKSRTPEEQAFEQGRALAYYEVVSTLINQAHIFGLSHEVLPLLDFKPDEELL